LITASSPATSTENRLVVGLGWVVKAPPSAHDLAGRTPTVAWSMVSRPPSSMA
jgi:hypothetical protein